MATDEELQAAGIEPDGYQEAIARAREYAPRVLAPAWREIAIPMQRYMVRGEIAESSFGGIAWRCVAGSCRGLAVLLSVAREGDGFMWLHVSTSRQDRTPSHDDLCAVKNQFIGDRLAVQVFPPRSEYVNYHPHTLHLWSRLDGPRLVPDLRKGALI